MSKKTKIEENSEKRKLPRLGSAPFLHKKISVEKIMWIVFLSLLPAAFFGFYIFGLYSFFVVLFSIMSAVASEIIAQKIRKKTITIKDGSAALTGLLLGMSMPPLVPLWLPIIGSSFAILIGKHAFGGLGHNIFNPALVGRAFLLASFPLLMTSWILPSLNYGQGIDAVTSATPLGISKLSGYEKLVMQYGGKGFLYEKLFFGNIGGSIGETSKFFLLLGGIFLIIIGIIDFIIPVGFFAGVIIGCVFLGQDFIFHLLSGGLILVAFFMATDYVTSPFTRKGKMIFGLGCGMFTILMRVLSSSPETVTYSVLLMNGFVPLIDRYVKEKIFGTKTLGEKK